MRRIEIEVSVQRDPDGSLRLVLHDKERSRIHLHAPMTAGELAEMSAGEWVGLTGTLRTASKAPGPAKPRTGAIWIEHRFYVPGTERITAPGAVAEAERVLIAHGWEARKIRRGPWGVVVTARIGRDKSPGRWARRDAQKAIDKALSMTEEER